MNLGLIELPRALRQFLSKRNASTQAFSLQDPTPGSIVGGNARGVGAVDLQMFRVAATQVASGIASVAMGSNNITQGVASVAMGSNNTASNSFCFAMGSNNTSNNNASAAIGNGNSATGLSSVSMGEANNASGSHGFAMGILNIASGSSSSCPGGARATTNNISGLLAYGFDGATLGRNQMSFFGARPITTDGTAKRATANDAAAATTNQLVLRNTSAFRFNARIVARDATTNDCKEWDVRGLIKRGANAAATALVGTPVITSEFADTAAAAWTIAVSADTTNGALAINVTGEAGKTIRWTVVVWSQEVN